MCASVVTALSMVASAAVMAWAADDNGKLAPGRRADQEALKAFAPLVGSWRGIGQVERGRTKGFWRESADWAWKLTSDSAGLEMTVKTGKYLKSGVLRPGKAFGAFLLEATLRRRHVPHLRRGGGGPQKEALPDRRPQGPDRRLAPAFR